MADGPQPIGAGLEGVPLGEALQGATSALAPQHAARAMHLAAAEGKQISQMLASAEGRKAALANRLVSATEILEDDPCEDEIVKRLTLLHCAAALLRVGEERKRRREFEHAARACGRAAYAVGEPFVSSPSLANGGAFERQAFGMWSRALHLLGDAAGELWVHQLGVSRRVWNDLMQRPLSLLQPQLSRRPFWPAADVPEARALEASHGVILAELTALLDGFSPYRSSVVSSGGWSDFQLFASCRQDVSHTASCPQTAELLASLPRLNSMVFGSQFFSRLEGGTHLDAHCGPSNLRLRVHLGLVVPPGCRIRVGDEVREWKAGECLVFDDSFEHEVCLRARAPFPPSLSLALSAISSAARTSLEPERMRPFSLLSARCGMTATRRASS